MKSSLEFSLKIKLGGLVAIGEVYVQFVRSLMPSEEVRQRISQAYDDARARLVDSPYNCAERRKYVCRIAFLPVPLIGAICTFGFLVVNKKLNVAQVIHQLFSPGDVLTFFVVVGVVGYIAGAIALYSIWQEKVYVLTSAIGDDGGPLQILFGIKD